MHGQMVTVFISVVTLDSVTFPESRAMEWLTNEYDHPHTTGGRYGGTDGDDDDVSNYFDHARALVLD